ncbi:Succinate dehydrogenase [ubiquinone] iron-sulfur subunit 3, mitochondrial [Linum perenne]
MWPHGTRCSAGIKAEMDPALTYRRSCREGICGSCAMNIDGNTVACLKPIYPDINKADLHYSFASHVSVFRSIEPWLKTKRGPEDGREYRQTPEERKKIDGLYECIMCACCSTACPSYWCNICSATTLLQFPFWVLIGGEIKLHCCLLQFPFWVLIGGEIKLHRCLILFHFSLTCYFEGKRPTVVEDGG